MKKCTLFIMALFISAFSFCQSPVITSWMINTTGQTGYNGLPSNVQEVQYDATNVYVSCSCIPGYDIGPWNMNPNTPSNQNFVFSLPRVPGPNADSFTAVGLGHIGVWINGVSIFNAEDAQSYNNLNVWHRNAYYFEEVSFDSCLGHPEMHGEYHTHINPRCLYNDANSSTHSPLIGFAFDGYPIYGAYGYTNGNDSTSPIKRMKPSYQMRTMANRQTLPDGTVLDSTNFGPPFNDTFPLGCFIEDYQFTQASGDLDDHNGRFSITPEYPAGTYAYFVTIDSALNPVFPYVLGLTYAGKLTTADVGMGGGHVTISDSTTIYIPDTTTSIKSPGGDINLEVVPNPTSDYVYLYFGPGNANNITGQLYNNEGQLLKAFQYYQPSIAYSIDLSPYATGTYFLKLQSGNESVVKKIVKTGK